MLVTKSPMSATRQSAGRSTVPFSRKFSSV